MADVDLDFSELRALFINCTLKRSPEMSHTQGLVDISRHIMEAHGIHVDVVDLRTVRPMDVEAIRASVEKTNRAVVLEEGWELAGIGAQVVDYIQRECFDSLDAPVIRVHQADVPMPYAKNLEKAAKPDVAKTIAAVRKVMYLD